jgi:flagellar motor switch protein FliN
MSNEQSVAETMLGAAIGGGVDARQAAGRPPAAEFPELRAERRPDTQGDIRLDAILDVPVTVSMEIGRSRISIRNLLQLNQGSVVELDRLAGEPMDVLVNGTLVAQGEVVVVNDKFGIRLTDIISPSERVRRLRG